VFPNIACRNQDYRSKIKLAANVTCFAKFNFSRTVGDSSNANNTAEQERSGYTTRTSLLQIYNQCNEQMDNIYQKVLKTLQNFCWAMAGLMMEKLGSFYNIRITRSKELKNQLQ
jgi:hypothetical protein